MKKFLAASAIVLTAIAGPAFAQDPAPVENQDPAAAGEQTETEVPISSDQLNVGVLVDQYATAALGFLVEQRCKQLEEAARNKFTEDFLILDEFMGDLIGVKPREQIVVNVAASADNAEINPCNPDTFNFALITSTMTSQLATRIQLSEGGGQAATLPAESAPGASSPTSTTSTKASTTPPATSKPVSLPPSTAPAGETKKEMKRRHRDEIIDLRRTHREELDRFDDNEDSYPDPKAAKKQLLDRQEQELDALRERQQREEDAREAASN